MALSGSQSRNGTYLNMRLAGSGVLADGDVLSIGFCQLRVSGDRLFVWSSKAVRVKPGRCARKTDGGVAGRSVSVLL